MTASPRWRMDDELTLVIERDEPAGTRITRYSFTEPPGADQIALALAEAAPAVSQVGQSNRASRTPLVGRWALFANVATGPPRWTLPKVARARVGPSGWGLTFGWLYRAYTLALIRDRD